MPYFNVDGINQRYDANGNGILIFAYKMLYGETVTVFGNGEQTRDSVNVRDLHGKLFDFRSTRRVRSIQRGVGNFRHVNELVDLMRWAGNLNASVEYGPPRKGVVRHSRTDISAAHASLGFRRLSVWMKGYRN